MWLKLYFRLEALVATLENRTDFSSTPSAFKRLLDIDNCCKAILDSMQGYMYEDDQQVWKLTVERGEKVKNGGCQVIIKEYL